MSSMESVVQDAGSEADRNMLLIAYVLHGLAVFTGISAVAAVIVNHIKLGETQNSLVRSHHIWMMRTFWWGLLWCAICGILSWILIGLAGFVVLGVWWLYRMIRGFMSFSERRAMPV